MTMLPASDRSVSSIMRDAKAIIQRDGWNRGGYMAYSGTAVCAVGAINKAATGNALNSLGPSLLRWDAVHLLREVVGCHIPNWNDLETTTLPDVMAAFDVAIVIAEEREAKKEHTEDATVACAR